MARFHNRYRPHRRNPAPLLLMGAPMLPLAAAAVGLYLLSKGRQQNPGNPVAGMGSLFSNVFQTAGQAIKESIANPLEVAIRVAVAPIKLATGSSWSSQVNSIKAPFQQAAATIKSASPSNIRGTNSAPAAAAAPACTVPNAYYDANGNLITYSQYYGLMTAQGLTPAMDDCSGAQDQVPPAADPDMTQSSNSVVQDPNQPGGLPGAAAKGKGKKAAATTSTVNPLMVAGGGVGAVALLYFMNK